MCIICLSRACNYRLQLSRSGHSMGGTTRLWECSRLMLSVTIIPSLCWADKVPDPYIAENFLMEASINGDEIRPSSSNACAHSQPRVGSQARSKWTVIDVLPSCLYCGIVYKVLKFVHDWLLLVRIYSRCSSNDLSYNTSTCFSDDAKAYVICIGPFLSVEQVARAYDRARI